MKYEEGSYEIRNTVDLKNKTNELLREVMKGDPIIIRIEENPLQR